jgi:putative ABC transport system ATP-binding protein
MEMTESRENIIVATKDLCKHVMTGEGRLDILDHIDVEIKYAESVAIVGVSGSGKSTLLSIMAGLDLPSSGAITLGGHRLDMLDEDGRATLRSRLVGFVFQTFQLLPAMSALENVMLPLELAGDAHARDKATQLLQRVGLGSRLQHYPRQLSGGEQQRVAIARAFVTRPDILFADEPTGNLDTRTGARVIDLLFELNREKNTTLVLVTHDVALAGRCSRQIHLDAGRITAMT